MWLSSRREYLNLDKWLTDQMREHGEPFVKAVVQNLQRKLPAIMGGPAGPLKEEHLQVRREWWEREGARHVTDEVAIKGGGAPGRC